MFRCANSGIVQQNDKWEHMKKRGWNGSGVRAAYSMKWNFFVSHFKYLIVVATAKAENVGPVCIEIETNELLKSQAT